MHQHGLLWPLKAVNWSAARLRYLLLVGGIALAATADAE